MTKDETRTRKFAYVVQDNYGGEGWVDHYRPGPKERLASARTLFEKRRNDPIWTNEGKRKWRIIRRCVTETVIS